MKTLTEKYKALEITIRLRIASKILESGIKSQFSSDKVLVVKKEEYQFNLISDRYLVEISSTNLIDNLGYLYSHSVLTIEQMCEVIDNI